MENYNIVFLGKNRGLFSFVRECLNEFEFNFTEVSEWNNFKKTTNDNMPSLIILSSDTEYLFRKKEFDKFRETGTGKIPVFIFSKDVVTYKTTAFFKEKLIETLKKTWAESVLPRKQVSFEPIKMGKYTGEKRKYPRINIKIPVEIFDDLQKSNKTDGFMRDISAGGISINCSSPLPAGNQFWLRFSLGDGKEYFLKSIKIREEKRGNYWLTAFRFKEILQSDKDTLKNYAATLLFLKETRLFEEFSEDELYYIVGIGKKVTVKEGGNIFSEGMEGRNLYIVLNGKIRIYRTIGREDERKEKLLAIIHPCEFFGEMALLKKIPRTASAQAMKDATLFKISKENLEKILLAQKKDITIKLYRAFISALIERLQMADHELIDSPFTKLRSKARF